MVKKEWMSLARPLAGFAVLGALLGLIPISSSAQTNSIYQDRRQQVQEIARERREQARAQRATPTIERTHRNDRIEANANSAGVDPDESAPNVSVGKLRFEQPGSGARQVDASGNVGGTDLTAASILATPQWHCFGQYRNDKPLYARYLFGATPSGLMSSWGERQREHQNKKFRDKIAYINQTLAGNIPAAEYERMSTVHGMGRGSREGQERRVAEVVKRERTNAMDAAIRVASDMVALNPGSAEVGVNALHLLMQVEGAVGEDASPELRCATTYFRDRYSSDSEEAIVAQYRELLNETAKDTYEPLNCPLAGALAAHFLEKGRPREAWEVLDRVAASAQRAAGPDGSMQAMMMQKYPYRECEYVNYLRGTMQAAGLGTKRSPAAAAESFRLCTRYVSACSYNLGVLWLSNQAPRPDSRQIVQMLQRAANSGEQPVASKARIMLDQHFSANQQVAARLPKDVLAYMAVLRVFGEACSADDDCRQLAKSLKRVQSTRTTPSWQEQQDQMLCNSIGFAGGAEKDSAADTWYDWNCGPG